MLRPKTGALRTENSLEFHLLRALKPASFMKELRAGVWLALLFSATLWHPLGAQDQKVTVEGLTQQLWPRERIQAALRDVEQQKAQGLLSDAAYTKRKTMLEARLTGTYRPESLSVESPPLNLIQNGGFE